MKMDYEPVDGASRQSWLASWLIAPVVAFVGGIALMGWALVNWDAAAEFIGVRPAAAPPPAARQPVAAPVAEPTPAADEAEPEPERVLIDPEVTRRVSQLERQIVEIDAQSRSAVGNADRAEGLLVAFAARRALDRGVPLGYIEGLLRQRFGNTQRQAIATIITASQQPVTLEELQQGLQEAGPDLTGVAPDQNWWTALKAELGELVLVRKADSPRTAPAARLERASRRLDAGQVDVALAEVLRMPGRESAGTWIANARRYVAARRALDTIETAALLEPRAPPSTLADTPGARR